MHLNCCHIFTVGVTLDFESNPELSVTVVASDSDPASPMSSSVSKLDSFPHRAATQIVDLTSPCYRAGYANCASE